ALVDAAQYIALPGKPLRRTDSELSFAQSIHSFVSIVSRIDPDDMHAKGYTLAAAAEQTGGGTCAPVETEEMAFQTSKTTREEWMGRDADGQYPSVITSELWRDDASMDEYRAMNRCSGTSRGSGPKAAPSKPRQRPGLSFGTSFCSA